MKFACSIMIIVPSLLIGPCFTIDTSVDLASLIPTTSVFSIFKIISGLIESTILSGAGSGSDELCVERCCRKPNYTAPVRLCHGVIEASPLSVSFLPRNNWTEQIDNVCYTYIQEENMDFIVNIAIVFQNNTFERFNYIVRDAYCPGVFLGAGPTCSYQDSIVSVQCNETFIIKRCHTFGTCKQLDAVIEDGFDVFFGLSSFPQQSDSCKDQQINYVKNLTQYNLTEYYKLPQKLPQQCLLCLPEAGIAFNAVNLQDKDKTCAKSNCTTDTDYRNETDVEYMFGVLKMREEESCKKS